jgi:hypothetical protein
MDAPMEALDAPSVEGVPVMAGSGPQTPPLADPAPQIAPLADPAPQIALPAGPAPQIAPPAGPAPRTPPPAYLWEAASVTSSGTTYRSARPHALVVVALLAATAVAELVAAGHRALDILTMDRIVGGPRTIVGTAAFDDQTATLNEVGLGLGLLVVVALAAWVARSVDNLGPLALATPPPPASPRMSISWWFIPLANLLMPLVVVFDLHRRVGQGRRGWIVLAWWLATLGGLALTVAAFVRGPLAGSVVDLRLSAGSVSGDVALAGEQVSAGAFAVANVVLALAAVLGIVMVRRMQAGAGRRARARAAYAARLAEDAPAVDAGELGVQVAAASAAPAETDAAEVEPALVPAVVGGLVAIPMGEPADIVAEVAN